MNSGEMRGMQKMWAVNKGATKMKDFKLIYTENGIQFPQKNVSY